MTASQRLGLALAITAGFACLEALAGWWSNSLALLSDAGHNVTDVLALGLSWLALELGKRPSHSGKTYGYHRVGILVALFNSATLILVAGGVFYEASRRLVAPPQVESGTVVVVGLLALVVNTVTALIIMRDSDHDLNIRSAFIHLMGDVISTVGVVLAAVGIGLTGKHWLDPAASVLVGGIILWSGWGILRESIDILLESTPSDVDVTKMLKDINSVSGVLGVHDVHVWSINKNLRAMSAHIVIEDIKLSEASRIEHQVREVARREYGISHATLQLECAACDPEEVYCDVAAQLKPPAGS